MKFFENQGQELAQILDTKAGPWIGPALEKEFEWQFDHPKATQIVCQQWILENKNELMLGHI